MIHKYDLWLNCVDAFLIEETGLASDDFEDWHWRDHFESGILPRDAAQIFLGEMENVDYDS